MAAPRITIRLYVQPKDSGHALLQLYKALEFHDYSDYQLTIIDVKEEPDKVLQDSVVSTPTVILESADGKKLASNDLADPEKLRALFGFKTTR